MCRIFILVLVLVVCDIGYGMRWESIGPDSPNRPTTGQPDWPRGIVEVVKHPSRVFSRSNGIRNSYFKADSKEINELLSIFSRARMRDHEVWIEPGKGTTTSFGGQEFVFNVSLQLPRLPFLISAREENDEEKYPLEPRLLIFAGENHNLLKQLKLPNNAMVRCNVDDFEVKSRLVKPKRKTYYGNVQFEDSSPTFGLGGLIRITLWEKGLEQGIISGDVDYKGVVRIKFSDKELTDLKEGRTWLTMTTGNRLVEAKPDAPIFPVEMLSLKQDEARAVKISPPKFYYGRILFEDGSPAVLVPEPWSGARISVRFPCAGSRELDSEGCFKVFFSKEQFEKVKSRKDKNNIYVPSYSNKRSSRANYFYPVSLLSQDKAKAGIVKIPRPKAPLPEPITAKSKIGKAVPDFDKIRFIEFDKAAIKDKPLLVCFWDKGQRPSRHCIRELAKQAEQLKEKGVVIISVQASKVDAAKMNEWVKKYNLPFPVGMIEGDKEKTKFK